MRRAKRHCTCTLAICIGLLPLLAGAATASSRTDPQAQADPAPAPPVPPEPAPPASPAPTPAAPPEPAPPVPPEGTPPASPAPLLPSEQPPEADTWLDTGHEAVSRSFFWTVERLDRFFSDEREVDPPRARSFVRWRNDLRIREDGALAAATDFMAEVRLPALDRRLERLRLSVTGSTVSAMDQLFPGSAQPDAVSSASVGLRGALLDTLRTSADAQVGLLFRLPLGWYTRLRLRRVEPLGWGVVARGAIAVFWQTNTGYGTRQDVSLERRLLPWLVARTDASGILTQRTRGYEWGGWASLLAAAGERTALSVSAGALGATDLGLEVERYRLLARVRRDVVRRWIFLEVEPQVEWTHQRGDGFRRMRAIVLRLELQFDAAALEDGSDTRPVTW